MTQRSVVVLAQLALVLAARTDAWSREYELPPAQRLDASRSLRRARPPFQLDLRSALIAPRKDSGASWDAQLGAGRRQQPSDFMQDTAMVRQLMRAIRSGSGIGMVTSILPWTAGAFTEGAAAPDVEISVLHDGAPLLTAFKVPNKFIPTWVDAVTPSLSLTPASSLAFVATDIDLALPDQIGSCWIDGIPLIDEDNYVAAESLRCASQLWALSIFVRELEQPSGSAAPAQPEPVAQRGSSTDRPARAAAFVPSIALTALHDLWSTEGNAAVRRAWGNRMLRVRILASTPIRSGDAVFDVRGKKLRCIRQGDEAEREFEPGVLYAQGMLMTVMDEEAGLYDCKLSTAD